MQSQSHLHTYGPTILRVGMALVFLWFGISQLSDTAMWVRLIPEWVMDATGFTASMFVHFNGAFEVVLGLCLLLGYFTRVSAFLLGLHLLSIMVDVGLTAIGVRDFGLFIAMVAIFAHGISPLSIDMWRSCKTQA